MCEITFDTTPGTEFNTGKSNDLWILKNFEKHDILFAFSVKLLVIYLN